MPDAIALFANIRDRTRAERAEIVWLAPSGRVEERAVELDTITVHSQHRCIEALRVRIAAIGQLRFHRVAFSRVPCARRYAALTSPTVRLTQGELMATRSRHWRTAALVIGVALVLAACGSDSKKTSTSTSASSSGGVTGSYSIAFVGPLTGD